MARNLVRDAALPITWLFLHTPVTANQVTLASLVIGVVGVICLALPLKSMFLIGSLLFQFWYLLDHVDGQIARYRKTACLSGRFFDFITHHLIHGIVFFGLGMYCFYAKGGVFFVVWGFVMSIGIMLFNLTHDTQCKTFFEKILTVKQILVKAVKSNEKSTAALAERTIFRKVFSVIHKACEIHVLMNILTFCALIEFFIPMSPDFRLILFLFYGLAVPFLAITKISYLILYRKIDREFEDLFSISEDSN